MNKYLKYAILTVVCVEIGLIIAMLALPSLVRALPGEYRVRLAKVPFGGDLLGAGIEPLPAALPIPDGAMAVRPQIVIPTLITSTPTTVPTSMPVTVFPKADVADEKRSVETAVSTNTPAPSPTPTVAPTPFPPPPQARIDGLEIIPQGFNNCGPANLTINLNFYDYSTTQEEAATFLKPNEEDRNVSPWQMVDYVNEETDMRAFFGSGGDIDLLKRLLAAGYPVVIEKGYELPTEGWLGHYLTLFGYDDSTGEMVSMDTNIGPWDGSGRYDTYAEIETYWGQFNNNFFLIYPPEKEAAIYAILGTEMTETAVMWQRAAQNAQNAIETDPDNAFAWFNLGTSLTRLGEETGEITFYENGAAAFDQAFVLGLPPRILWYQYRPYIAYMKVGRYQDMLDLANTILETQGGQNVEETYLYKGHAFAFLGNGVGAVEAYRQALLLNENFYPAQWALDSIIGG